MLLERRDLARKPHWGQTFTKGETITLLTLLRSLAFRFRSFTLLGTVR